MGKPRKRTNYGKGWVHKNDYIAVWEPKHPLANSNGYVLQHRKVAWDAGILTQKEMVVHHINGDRLDNRLENLEVMPLGQHTQLHRTGCFWYSLTEEQEGWIRKAYGPVGVTYAYLAGIFRVSEGEVERIIRSDPLHLE